MQVGGKTGGSGVGDEGSSSGNLGGMGRGEAAQWEDGWGVGDEKEAIRVSSAVWVRLGGRGWSRIVARGER